MAAQMPCEKSFSCDRSQNIEEADPEFEALLETLALWVFGTAFTSVATAAIAGVLAFGGFNFLD